MRKQTVLLNLFIWCLSLGLFISCDKDDDSTDSNKLIGIWESVRVDTLAKFIIPQKENVFSTMEYKMGKLNIDKQGLFTMVNLNDTMSGNWIQPQSDSIRFSNLVGHGSHVWDSKIVVLTDDSLVLSYSYGQGSVYIDPDLNTQTEFNIKISYTRKR